MSFGALLLRNLRFHWRGHLAVLLGVALGSAVLTGALLVGDSLRGSLRDRAEQQRCGVDYALVSPKFFSPVALPDANKTEQGILLRGSIHVGKEGDERTVQNVTVL